MVTHTNWTFGVRSPCVAFLISLLYFGFIQSLAVSARHCDPFSQNGILQVSPDDPWNNKWLTLGGRCENSDVLTPTLQASWSLQRPSVTPLFYDGIEAVDADSGPDVRALKGKTVVLIGDSLTRGNTFQFCSLFGEKPVRIYETHPYMVPTPSSIHPTLDKSQGFPRITPPNHSTNDGDGHEAHYCYIPSIDLMVIQVFTFGMDEEFYWEFREKGLPYLYDYRVSYLAAGIAQRTGRGEPDLVMVGSALWDSARWMREDLKNDVDSERGLSRERVDWYRNRVADVLNVTRTTFPRSTIKWMSNHYPIVAESNGWFTAGAEGNKKRPVNKVIRLAQMNSISRAVVESGVGNAEIFKWGEIMLGQEAHQIDDLHTAVIPGGILFSEMLLHYLYRLH